MEQSRTVHALALKFLQKSGDLGSFPSSIAERVVNRREFKATFLGEEQFEVAVLKGVELMGTFLADYAKEGGQVSNIIEAGVSVWRAQSAGARV